MKPLLAEILTDQSTVKDMCQSVMKPESTPRAVGAIQNMVWSIFVIGEDSSECFITSDNPVFIYDGKGQLTFPISSKLALVGTKAAFGMPSGYMEVPKQQIKEINRRTVHNATRFIFHMYKQEWLSLFVSKRRWQLDTELLTFGLP